MENFQPLGDTAHDLQLVGVALHIGKALFHEHLAVVHDTHMVADILQLPQVVRGNQHRGAVLGNVGQNQAHDLPPHDGVQAVHRLVQNQCLGPGAQGQMEGRLLLHTLGEAANLAPFRQAEHIVEPVEQFIVKLGVNSFIEFAHILQGCGGVVKNVVGDVADGGFDLRVFVNGLAVHGNYAAVGPVNAGEVPDGGGFARAVGAHETVDRTLGHR